MTFDEYMGTFHLLQTSLERAEKDLELAQGTSFRRFLSHFGQSGDPYLMAAGVSEAALRERVEKRRRLCERYAARIARAVSRMTDPYLREYALCRYLYGMTHEEIADRSYFCVRTVYRHARHAKRELEKQLLKLMPRVQKTDPCRYTVKGPLPRRTPSQRRPSSFGALKRRAASIKSASFYESAPLPPM